MAEYVPPSREIGFVINELLDYSRLAGLNDFSEATTELTSAVLEEAAKFAGKVMAPLNRIGDQQGIRQQGDEVITPDGFADAYQLFVENQWLSLAQDPQYGGQGLPYIVHLAASEMWNSACASMAICPLLTAGGIDALIAHASEELKDKYLPSLVSGKWTATMNLTESHAGSDLSTLKTRAEPDGEIYRIRGQKIFITWGEHDMAENILHLVLAPMVDAPAGNRGLSLFLVPKFLVADDGRLGERNDLRVIATEDKLGIHASPTCVMSFGENKGAVGYLIGQAGDGLACMFTLMNHARLEVGLQGLSLSERSYQDALAYAKDRVQGRNIKTGAPAAIIEHADVQRMLMSMKSLTEAMRGLTYDGAFSHDLEIHGKDETERAVYKRRFALLTPLIKAWCTELVNEITSLGIQVHGGMGFIEETGAAQHYRDARILSIYEGTNGIQANDLVERKVLRDQGVALASYVAEMLETAERAKSVGALESIAIQLEDAVANLQSAAVYVFERASTDQKFVGAIAYNFLMMMGYVAGGWYMAQSAEKALAELESGDATFYRKKLLSVNFYFAQMLPRHKAYLDALVSGADIGIELNEESF
ncbi:MAG: acyl-CoA dehydrogenase [Gammaproteobacteria bacterium]|jgi:3-(methylthio)propanoyl-CoA dehydrogenase|nr:acyl-CoA dehydrogenase [Gammaproteobacteria bacterium]MBT5204924.1 acyl-CoA dehydrogenase [Gammaproteobacteria bacterium]MBT5600883.1 acyl-CoA dehydrogenase [Gammaproteobacteria bacterium]MBT6247208.1 acyl-CoA dehydrogenase [Gammaproteobacteria bacterium]